MFRKNRNSATGTEVENLLGAIEEEIYSPADAQEWEEYVVANVPESDQPDPDGIPEYVVNHPEELMGQEKTGYDYAALSYEADDKDSDGINTAIDATAFPAIRLAYGLDTDEQPEEKQAETDEYITAVLDEDEWRMELINYYAGMDDEEPDETAPAISAEDSLPELFRQQPVSDNQRSAADEEEQTEFTMESELELQRTISGELFSYIDTIEQDSRSLIRQREMARAAAAQPKKLDPYNLNFNNRYDDLEEVLSNTPEISLKPKFEMEE